MPIITELPPLSLYIHLPWCVQKCPYCDFNSHEVKDSLPEELYVNALMQDLEAHLAMVQGRPLISIFFGGGTPSLFSPSMIGRILQGVFDRLNTPNNIEITLEANPGTMDAVRFKDFRSAGINRISLGLQSLQNDKLKTLGRIHDSYQAMRAIDIAKNAGFDNFNLDLMFGLPQQTIDDALFDLQTALSFQPTHLSWYQLTIEPNTVFYKHTPTLPHDDYIFEMQAQGQALLSEKDFQQYEVSAYSQKNKQCLHNTNYWEFGDYLGIGAGAHSKITDIDKQTIQRFAEVKQPNDYLDKNKRRDVHQTILNKDDLIFEFMLNALRLTQGVDTELFQKRTGVAFSEIAPIVTIAKNRGLLLSSDTKLSASTLGAQFLNDLVSLFLVNK